MIAEVRVKRRLQYLTPQTLKANILFLCRSNQRTMWKALGEGILRYKTILLIILLAATAFMGWHASKVKLSYDFARAIPTDNPKYQAYQEFRK